MANSSGIGPVVTREKTDALPGDFVRAISTSEDGSGVGVVTSYYAASSSGGSDRSNATASGNFTMGFDTSQADALAALVPDGQRDVKLRAWFFASAATQVEFDFFGPLTDQGLAEATFRVEARSGVGGGLFRSARGGLRLANQPGGGTVNSTHSDAFASVVTIGGGNIARSDAVALIGLPVNIAPGVDGTPQRLDFTLGLVTGASGFHLAGGEAVSSVRLAAAGQADPTLPTFTTRSDDDVFIDVVDFGLGVSVSLLASSADRSGADANAFDEDDAINFDPTVLADLFTGTDIRDLGVAYNPGVLPLGPNPLAVPEPALAAASFFALFVLRRQRAG